MVELLFHSVKPPAIYKAMLVTMATGKLVLWPFAAPILDSSWLSVASGLLLFGGGALLAVAPKKLFQRTQTPMMGGPSKTSPLHTEHAFAHTRNPMYLGISIGLAGAALLTNIRVHLIFPVVNVLIMNTFYIPKEEAELLKRFGKEYGDYRKRVRRWI
ncbi:Methyltransferase [Seminavis robusta]|uniref:Methyltransferase n=1 Tax=Seminavis robusta TaxID=568900 RepID=A0A9N8E2R8_9STRA|nr:Methyltransferase [Seminavis robusta]|eukprot:Sro590_g171910.1 Methyltransferase (158) ;mRNA; f:42678-43151